MQIWENFFFVKNFLLDFDKKSYLISDLKELNKIKDEINKFFDKKGIKPLFISASENMGIDELKNNLNKLIG